MLPWRAPLLMPSVQVLPKSTPRSVQTHPRMAIGVHHRSALIISLLMSAQRGWARLGEQFRPRVRAQLRTFFNSGEKVRKTPSPECSRELEEDAEKPPPSTRESTICSTIRSELVPERHAPQLNAVLGENLEDRLVALHDQEPE